MICASFCLQFLICMLFLCVCPIILLAFALYLISIQSLSFLNLRVLLTSLSIKVVLWWDNQWWMDDDEGYITCCSLINLTKDNKMLFVRENWMNECLKVKISSQEHIRQNLSFSPFSFSLNTCIAGCTLSPTQHLKNRVKDKWHNMANQACISNAGAIFFASHARNEWLFCIISEKKQ